MSDFEKDFKRQIQELEEFIGNDLLEIIEVEGLNHFEESFDNEGFTDGAFEKWKPRKKTDKKGRDLTTYRTNRVGRKGNLTSFGRKNKGRSILTGHNSGGNKLKHSLRATKVNSGVDFTSDKEYAKRHNEGDNDMPKRQFIGKSKILDTKIENKIDKQLDKIFEG